MLPTGAAIARALEDADARPGPTTSRPGALVIASVEYPALAAEPLPDRTRRPRRPGARRGGRARRRGGPGPRPRRGHQPLPLRHARLPRQPRAVRRRPQQLPESGHRPPHRHSDHDGDRLHGGGPARRPARRGHQLPRSLPGARLGRRGRGRGRRRPHRRRLQRRGDPDRAGLPRPCSRATKTPCRSGRTCWPGPHAGRSSCGCW